ncbi:MULTISPECIES: hypothetical protein [Enterobacter cloacae complex]|nr:MULTISPECIES: hypothetical protein [Enterobacter cloacae complex]MCK7230967.1 hypothetical protein [Enterobacter roggenkampii]SSI12702.1 Uncharacterised protein [Enterobacter hormaechei]
MSNIDKQALNQEKIEWLNKLADMEYCKSNPGHWLMSLKDTNMLAKLALRSVALLDELEAAEKTSAARLGAIDTTHKMFQRERDRAEKAEKRIAELEAREVVLPSSHDVHPLGPQSAKIFWEFHRSIVNRCADEIRKVGVKVSIKGN